MKRHINTLLKAALVMAMALSPLATAQNTRFSGIVTTGDSLSDLGRFYAATGNTLPPFPYFEGRFSNGPVWPEYLASLLDTELDPDCQLAMGGAMTGSDNFRSLPPNFVLPGFQQQITAVLDKNGNDRVDPRAIYTVWVGANDFFAWLASGNPDPTNTILDGVANTINGVSDLADAGASHFVIINLPDLGMTPAAQALPPGAAGLLSLLSANYNALLDQQLDQFEADRNVTIVRINAFELINHVVANPDSYGLTNVTDMAVAGFPVADPDQYLFWDHVHPTTVIHEIIAETVYYGIRQAFPTDHSPKTASAFRSGPIRAALQAEGH